MGAMNQPQGSERRIEGLGTTDREWQDWGGLADLPPVTVAELVPPGRRAIIVAPHPDDEVLGCGGLMQLLAAQHSRTVLVAVTDGGASHPGSLALPPAQLLRTRRDETARALAALELGTDQPQLLRAGLPDGAVAAHMAQLQSLLEQLLRPGDVVLTTWRMDGHPDHEACGLAVAMAVRLCRATLVELPIWSWHWAAPGDARLPWRRARRLELPPAALQRKRDAVACYRSQLEPDPSTGRPAILSADALARLLHPYEVYFL